MQTTHPTRGHRVGRTLAAAVAALALAGPAPQQAHAADVQPVSTGNSLLLVLDASGSMAEPAGGGQTRMQAAKKALVGLVGELPDGGAVGLRVYGATQDSGCSDTKLVVPVGPVQRGQLTSTINGFEPRGDTPIGASLQAAADDLRDAPGRRTVVLVSDGEDNCAPPDPCDVARRLAEQGLDLRVEAIGFQVGPDARKQLECIAKATGGSYYDAPDARALAGQLQALSLRAFRGFAPTGEPVTGTPEPTSAPAIEPGAYVDSLAPGETKHFTIDVPAGAVPVVNGALSAGATQPRLAGPENFIVSMTGPGGRECARGSSSQTSETFTAGATAVGPRAVDGGTDCTAPGPLTVAVERQFDGGQGTNTVELLYTLVGEPAPDAEPAPAVEPGPQGGQATPTAVQGGTSYNDAPVIGSGSWSDTLRSSETLYYRVPVGWGQSLETTVQFSLLTSGEGAAGRMQPLVEVHDALRADPGNRQITQVSGSGPQRVTISTPAVRAPVTADDPVTPFAMAGDMYVVVNGSDLLGEAEVAAATMRIDVAVTGAQVEGPRLSDPTAVVVEPTPTASPPQAPPPDETPTEVAAAPPAEDDEGSAGWVLPVGIGFVAVLLALGAALLVRRRR